MKGGLPVVTLTILGEPQQFTWDTIKQEFRPVAGGPRLPLAVALLGASVGWLKGLDVAEMPHECAESCTLCGGS